MPVRQCHDLSRLKKQISCNLLILSWWRGELNQELNPRPKARNEENYVRIRLMIFGRRL